MPIALESNQIGSPGLRRGMFCGSSYNSTENARSVAGDLRLTAFNSTSAGMNLADEGEDQVDTSSSSSIGRNSDSSDGDGDSGEVEVQSPCKGPLDCLDALEEVLPVKYAVIYDFVRLGFRSFVLLLFFRTMPIFVCFIKVGYFGLVWFGCLFW